MQTSTRDPETSEDHGNEESTDVSAEHLSDFVSPPPPDVDATLSVVKHAIPFSMLDPDAVKVVRRLNRFGHKAYLVGGCVRDILLGIQPKDFDVVTSAMPAEVRRHFRNCRLIGRRFRLAHLHFRDRKIIEVATFRRTPTEADDITGKHAAENLFGGPADDAIRRDFTINALMYDVGRREIRDWVGGLADVERGILKTIGDPERRIPEDPVRILRAIKFSIRLGLDVDTDLLDSMQRHANLIKDSAPARLVEEVFKLLRSGQSEQCISMAYEIGLLHHLMPELARHLEREETGDPPQWHPLRRADEMLKDGKAVSDPVLLTALLFDACRETLGKGGDLSRELEQVLLPLVAPLPFTRRHLSRVRQILIAQRRLEKGPRTRRNRKILDREYGAEAIDILWMTSTSPEQDALAKSWREAVAHRHTGEMPPPRPQPRRRRRPGRAPKDDQ